MSALEGTRTATGAGKDILDGTLPSVDGVHPALPFPHLPYGDAVFAEILDTVPHPPEPYEAGVGWGTHRVLFLRMVWLPEHPGLGEAARADGLTLRWSHVTGWSAHTAVDSRQLPLGPLAEPVLVADAAQHFARHGLSKEWVEPFEARWEHAPALDAALTAFEDQGARR